MLVLDSLEARRVVERKVKSCELLARKVEGIKGAARLVRIQRRRESIISEPASQQK